MNIIEFQPNTPQILTLASTERYPLRNKGFWYETPGDSWFFLDIAAVESFQALQIQPGESFGICLRKNKRGVYWDIWLTPETEQKRASQEIEQETGEDLTPTGTDGPSPVPAALPSPAPGLKLAKTRIPYNVAFREIVAFITTGLKDAGEQWNDQAKQDAICTVLIQATRDGYLTLWER